LLSPHKLPHGVSPNTPDKLDELFELLDESVKFVESDEFVEFIE
jgi:hypothetical protein